MSAKTIGSIRLVRYFSEDGVKAAFVRRGRKFLKVITLDSPISVTKVRISDERYMQPLKKGDNFYPFKRGVSKFWAAARNLGITQGAKAILAQADAQGGYPADLDLEVDGNLT